MSVIDLVMMALVVLVTVSGLQAVGLILVVALLIIPPVAARFWTERLWLLVLIAGLIGAASGYFGSAVSALFPRKPAGAVIVLTSGAIFTISMLFAPARGMIALMVRRLQLRLKVGGDHLLEHAYELKRTGLDRAEILFVARKRGWSLLFRVLLMLALRQEGMFKRSSRAGIELSDDGLLRGARVNRNHALWEQYLVSYADIAPSHVDWSVDLVEHVLSDELVQELETKLRARGVSLPSQQGAES